MSRPPRDLPPELRNSVFSTRDGARLGLTDSRMRGADLGHPHRGARMHGLAIDDLVVRCRAYGTVMGDGHYFTHATAALLYGVPLPPSVEADRRLHVSVPRGENRPRGHGIVGHRPKEAMPALRARHGVPVAGPEYVWCTLAPLLGFEALVAAGDFLVSGRVLDEGREPPLSDPERLRRLVDSWSGRPGARLLREALESVRTGVDSPRETALRLLIVGAGLPEPAVNVPAFGASGVRLGTPDLSYPELRTTFEYEGDGHREKDRFRRDIARYEVFAEAGWRPVRITARDLAHPMALADRLRRTVAARVAEAWPGLSRRHRALWGLHGFASGQ